MHKSKTDCVLICNYLRSVDQLLPGRRHSKKSVLDMTDPRDMSSLIIKILKLSPSTAAAENEF